MRGRMKDKREKSRIRELRLEIGEGIIVDEGR
jgi:hypothetical protein